MKARHAVALEFAHPHRSERLVLSRLGLLELATGSLYAPSQRVRSPFASQSTGHLSQPSQPPAGAAPSQRRPNPLTARDDVENDDPWSRRGLWPPAASRGGAPSQRSAAEEAAAGAAAGKTARDGHDDDDAVALQAMAAAAAAAWQPPDLSGSDGDDDAAGGGAKRSRFL